MSKLLNFYEDFDKPVPEHRGGVKKTLDTDLIVVGGGGAGLAAAARAAEQGLRVVVLEKMPQLGGNTRLAGGLLCTNSEILQAAGLPDTTEEHIDTYRRWHLYQLDCAIYERFIRNTGPFYDWLVSKGLDADNRHIVMDKVVMIKDRSTWEPLHNPAYGPGLMGSAVTELLEKLLRDDEKVTILTETKVTALHADERGAVCSVSAVGGGSDWDIYGKNVILASGGFGCNDELLKKYFPEYCASDSYFTHYCLNHSTGDGLLLAEAIGAETGKNMSIGLEAMKHMPGAYTLQRVSGQPEGVIVSATGKRFVSEDDMDNGEFALDAQPEGLGWFIFTEPMKERLYELAIENSRYGDWMPEIGKLYEDLELEIQSGKVKYGETVEALAAGIGAPADILKKTLSDYEAYCAAGHDPEFRKDPQYLLPLGSEGPWYAVSLIRKFDVTMGGVTIDAKNRALRPDGSVIPGLYVCGDIASGWMGRNYGPLFSSFAWAVNSGFLTADECSQSK